MNQAIIKTPFGYLGILANDTHLVKTEFLFKKQPTATSQNALLKLACARIQAYLDHGDPITDLPLQSPKTPMQVKLRKALLAIAPGRTRSYGELARRLNSSAQGIGMACRANALPVIIPCHRVVAKDHLGGFAGQRRGELIDVKSWLLAHETHIMSDF